MGVKCRKKTAVYGPAVKDKFPVKDIYGAVARDNIEECFLCFK
jgi:hypothetical protein